MQAVITLYILMKMAGEWLFNPSVHRAKGDRLVRRALPDRDIDKSYLLDGYNIFAALFETIC